MPSISGPSITSSGARELLARLLGVGLDEVDDAVHERVREALLDRRVAPGEVELALLARALHVLGELDQALGRVGAAVEEHVLDVLEQLLAGCPRRRRAGPALTMPMSMPARIAW